jgi:membrane fusion protein (multidrug efflux system)
MPAVFSRSVRALEADGFGRSIAGLLLVAILLGAWTVWFFRARVALYEVSDLARLEVDQAARLLQSNASGRVVSSRLVLDAVVKAGDVLVELDSNPQRLQLEEQRARLASLSPQIEALHQEATAEEQARTAERQASGAAADQARAQLREAQVHAAYAKDDAFRLERLHAEGLVGDREWARGKSEVLSTSAAAESMQLAITRMDREQHTRDTEREVRIRRINESITGLESQRRTIEATIQRLLYEIDQRSVRAPADGRLGEVENLKIGAVVREGETLATIVPSGTVKVVAEFPPASALGKIRAGQPARLRLQGFPWTQYGTMTATVSKVGSEVRDQRVRVELLVNPQSASRIPRQHGLPGSVEVQVESISPALLMLRAAGRMVGGSATPSSM